MGDRHLANVAYDSSEFVGSLGVNTHVGWSKTPYGDLQKVAAGARYLGVHNLRDSLDASSYAGIDQLAGAGFKFDLESHSDLKTFMRQVGALAQAHPGFVAAIEGPNEVDGWPISYNGKSGYPAASAFQAALYAQVRADRLLRNVPVYNVTVSGLDARKYEALGDLSGATDYANVHIYYGGGQPSYGWSQADPTFHWNNWLAAGQIGAPGKPTVITETGASSAHLWGGGVDETTQAKQILNALMNSAKSGVAATYLYELVESRRGDATNSEAHYGLFRYDWTPKPAAVAVHNFTRILTDGSATGGFNPGALEYIVQGLPETGQHFLFQEQHGVYDLVVWAEPDVWNETTHTPIPAPTAQVTVSLAAPRMVAVYDPLKAATPLQSLGRVTRLTVSLTDHPLIIELR
ncbi:hypothetical protein DJ021_13425 [Phenylobacterium hankyongense]|uniref:Asl1-like glycosyl hydrolase catalytic domain-containing protein n=1 Tax=Phenylobacterium hankyongense TaxID=1813876 RepID=A0A328B1P8_9CAUL|nr:hypothetical protein [Phenylobacterium hankyongense]RAK60737.1 hypothetical protein DJ021_13425 [Phenylobacterium hankyongense]